MDSLDSLKQVQPPVPAPDMATWTNSFTGWGVWTELAGADNDPTPHEFGSGLLVMESKVAGKRLLGWAAALAALSLFTGLLSAGLPIIIVASVVFGAAALYRIVVWFLNQDLRVRIFREGFSIRKNGETRAVRWTEIATVRENWLKYTIEFIRINIHTLTITLKNGQIIKLDLTLDKIEKIGGLIQSAVADSLLPEMVDILNNDRVCDFGPFKISRYGIAHGDNKVLPWSQVKSISVGNTGQAGIEIHQVTNKKLAFAWATQAGGAIPNYHLFINLTEWFIRMARQPVRAQPAAPTAVPSIPAAVPMPAQVTATAPAPAETVAPGDVHYKLVISEKEAQQGGERRLRIGTAGQEMRLLVKIPPGIPSGTVYHFPGHGEPGPGGGSSGVLHIHVEVDTRNPVKNFFASLQIVIGSLFLFLGAMWLGFYSTLDLITSAILMFFIGGIGGLLVSLKRRWIGALSGAVGGVISLFLQYLYYSLNYIFFDRETFWEYEMVLVLIVSFLPGIGLYILLTKKRK